MKIVICGSMAFAKDMLEIKTELKNLGHNVILPKNCEEYVEKQVTEEKKWAKIEGDLIRNYFNEIKESDAVLVLNKDKNDIKNYVGGNSLIEMAFAHALGKKIFLLNPISALSYTDEIETMEPIILEGNLKNIEI